MTSRETSTGIAIYRASRLEALLDPLLALLDSNPPDATLAPQTIIAAHPGMKQWLLGALARKRGAGGIVANLDVPLPSAWLDELAQATLGESAIALRPYRREFLRWRIHDALDDLDDPRLRAYLQGPDVDRRRFQLADRLALIYTQYLVYRPDWLEAWAAGRDAIPDPGFLAPLWKRLRTTIDQPHRGERLARLLAKIEQADAIVDVTPLHVFGISHLAPTELAVLRAVAKHRLVVLYIPDPCREFWAGMTTERARLRELVKREPGASDTESAFLQMDHPLLANWGRIGQHFMLLLEDSDIAIDVRHHQDKPEAAIEPANRLEWLQEGIRRAQPDLHQPANALTREDASLRVHACHTRLRELEVLRDALLLQLKQRPDLKPSDILVMAPNIQDYAPLLPAVFGEAGHRQSVLPYHLADVAIERAHPLFDAFARLLDLPRSRLTAPEVIDLLALPPVAGRFGLGDSDLDAITRWLRNARVAWGLDGTFRARFDVPPIQTQTFAWGIDRMLAGYVMGSDTADAQQAVELADGSAVLPLNGIAGPQAATLGTLDDVLAELARWCSFGGRTQSASAWARQLEERIKAMLRIDATDRAARDAWDALLHAVHAIASGPAQGGLDPPLAFEVVRELLRERLSAISERQRFLMGGTTFCGMVPQRAIPFAIVAVLGLDDGVFPRTDNGAGLDPIGEHRRIGDRDVRNDDRYLFLQTMMSARAALHLSYIGCDVRDGKARNPAAPLADLLSLLDHAAGLSADDKDIKEVEEDGAKKRINRRPWLVRHPLQPFDVRYFDGADPALFSFRAEFALTGANGSNDAEQPTSASEVVAGIAATEPSTSQRIAPLREVLAYFKAPAKDFLTRRAKLRLYALADDRLHDSESLDAQFDRIERVGRRVFLDAIASTREVPQHAPDWLRLSGLLPPGKPGDRAWGMQAGQVAELLVAAKDHALFASGMPQSLAVPLQRDIGAYRIEGELSRAFATDGARWVFDVFPGKKEDALDFQQRIGLFLEWALLRLNDPQATQRARLYVLCIGGEGSWQQAINVWDDAFVAAEAGIRERMAAQLGEHVIDLLNHWWTLQSDPRWYFPKTSWASANPQGKSDPVVAAWNGFGGRGERNYASGYESIIAGDAMFEPGTNDRDRLDTIANALRDAITLSISHGPVA